MKRLMFAFLIGSMAFFASCDKCKDVSCENGGTCNDGNCECTTFYEGDKCGTEVRAKYAGTYEVITEITGFGKDTSTATIAGTGTDASKLTLTIDGDPFDLTLTDANGSFSMSYTDTDGTETTTVTGTGSFTSTGMSATATVNVKDPSNNLDITLPATMTGTKK